MRRERFCDGECGRFVRAAWTAEGSFARHGRRGAGERSGARRAIRNRGVAAAASDRSARAGERNFAGSQGKLLEDIGRKPKGRGSDDDLNTVLQSTTGERPATTVATCFEKKSSR